MEGGNMQTLCHFIWAFRNLGSWNQISSDTKGWLYNQSPKVPFKSLLHYHSTKGPPVQIFKFSSRCWVPPAHPATRGVMASDLGWGPAFSQTQVKVIFDCHEEVLECHSCPAEEALQEELLVGYSSRRHSTRRRYSSHCTSSRHRSTDYREGNGSPPQCSCLENPRDGGAW